MALVLQDAQFEDGLQSETMLLLSALEWIMDTTIFPNPFAVLDVKTALEANQAPNTFNTVDFDQYIQRLYDLPLKSASLTLSERTRLNIIREYLDPPPSVNLCDEPGSTPAVGNTTLKAFERIGSATQEHELQVQFDPDVTCDVYEVEVTSVTPLGGAPAFSTGTPFSIFFLGADFDINKAVYSYLWIDFAADPSGFSYDFALDVKDETGASLATYTETIAVP